jgi:hypothetical protein
MCPACLTTISLIAAGASSTEGLAAFVRRAPGGKSGAETADRRPKREIEPCSTTGSQCATNGFPRAKFDHSVSIC